MKNELPKRHTCPFCLQTFARPRNMRAHIASKHTKQYRFFCSLCDMGFATSTNLKRHSKFVHMEPRFSCDLCQKKFKYENTLKMHTQRHKLGGLPRYKCSNCDKTYQSRDQMRRHEYRCKGLSTMVKCDICQEVVDSTLMSQHRRLHKEAKYECEVCHKKFREAFPLKMHARFHTGELRHPCDICGKMCATKASAELHRKVVHIKEFQAFCEICGKGFVKSFQVKNHVKTSHRQETNEPIEIFHCPIEGCSKTYKSKTALKFHLPTHDKEKPVHSCPHCPKVLHHPVSLRQHILLKHTEGKPVSFTCHLCDKQLASNASLKLHLKWHTGEKPFTCEYCDRSFNTRSLLKIHSVVHTKERPYGCKVCDKTFTQQSTLKGHFLKAHPDEKWERGMKRTVVSQNDELNVIKTETESKRC